MMASSKETAQIGTKHSEWHPRMHPQSSPQPPTELSTASTAMDTRPICIRSRHDQEGMTYQYIIPGLLTNTVPWIPSS